MTKYAKYIFITLLVSGLLAISYGGCGGGTTEDTGGGGGGGGTNPAPAPNPDPTACEGDAFIGSGSNAIECLSEYLVQNAETSALTCFCNASEAGDFILNISQTFLSAMSINIEFPDDPDALITSFNFDWDTAGCGSIELFAVEPFGTTGPTSIGKFDNMMYTEPDELSFTANVSESLLSALLGSSGQSVSCDYCSIGALPPCAPGL